MLNVAKTANLVTHGLRMVASCCDPCFSRQLQVSLRGADSIIYLRRLGPEQWSIINWNPEEWLNQWP